MASLPLERDHHRTAHQSAGPAACADGLLLAAWQDFASSAAINEWDTLARTVSEPNPFYESWSLLPALVNLDRDRNVRLMLFWQGGKLLGLMPVARAPRYYGYLLPHWCNWTHCNSFCGSPLVAAGSEQAFWEAVLKQFDTRPGSALFLHLAHMPESGALYDALCSAAGAQGRPCGVVHREQRALLRSDQRAQDYFAASVSGKKRKELRRQHKRLSELGAVRFHRYTDAYKIDAWCDDFLRLEAAGWKGRESSALACQPETAAMFRTSLHGAATRGRLERLSLSLDGEPIAMLVNYLCAPGSFSFKTAFDEDYARFSPGVLLQRENLDLLGRTEIDWCDSCAAADHPMIERIWREKRSIVRANIGIGGSLRQKLFQQILRAETARLGRDF